MFSLCFINSYLLCYYWFLSRYNIPPPFFNTTESVIEFIMPTWTIISEISYYLNVCLILLWNKSLFPKQKSNTVQQCLRYKNNIYHKKFLRIFYDIINQKFTSKHSLSYTCKIWKLMCSKIWKLTSHFMNNKQKHLFPNIVLKRLTLWFT